MNDERWKSSLPIQLERFNTIKPHINKYIDIIYGVEHKLYSNELQTAGTADIIASYNNINTIIDIKTSSKPKKETDVLSYFLQCTAYAIMVEELYDLKIDQIIIIIILNILFIKYLEEIQLIF